MSVVDSHKRELVHYVIQTSSEGMSVVDSNKRELVHYEIQTSSEGMSVVERFLAGSTHCVMGIPNTSPSVFALQSKYK
jgi:hypothetical protein